MTDAAKKFHVYVIHASHLKDRDANIQKLRTTLATTDIKNAQFASFHLIEDFDPPKITQELVKNCVDYKPLEKDDPFAILNGLIKNLHVNQLSNSLKHAKVIQMIAKNGAAEDMHIVLEDDVLFDNTLAGKLQRLFDEYDATKHPFVSLGLPYVGNATAFIAPINSEIRVLPVIDSYIVTTEAAEKLKSVMLPIKFATNVQLDYCLKKLDIPIQQTIQNVFVDGSKFGTTLSTQTANNQLMFNTDYITLRNIVEKPDSPTAEDDAKVQEFLEKSPIRQHPDFKYCLAKYLTRKGRFSDAEKIFTEVYNFMLTNQTIVNHSSLLLKDFIRLHANLQSPAVLSVA